MAVLHTLTLIHIAVLQRRLCRKAAAKMFDRSTSRCVSDSSQYIRSRAQYAAKRLVLVKVNLPKGTGGLTGHHHASPSHDRAAHTGGWRRPLLRIVTACVTALPRQGSARVCSVAAGNRRPGAVSSLAGQSGLVFLHSGLLPREYFTHCTPAPANTLASSYREQIGPPSFSYKQRSASFY